LVKKGSQGRLNDVKRLYEPERVFVFEDEGKRKKLIG